MNVSELQKIKTGHFSVGKMVLGVCTIRFDRPGMPTLGSYIEKEPHMPDQVRLQTNDRYDILRLLEYAGVSYLSPASPAAEQGIELFKKARDFIVQSHHEWVGFDWDFTTNSYRIYSPIVALVELKWWFRQTKRLEQKRFRSFEVQKPAMYELIFGMAVGFAIKQGLVRFGEWERYQPRVRWVTQTWPSRLSLMGTHAVPLIPLMMGRLPGSEVGVHDIRRSDAFITLEDFLSEITYLLQKLQKGKYRMDCLRDFEREEVMEVLSARKGYQLKPLSAFERKRWSLPTLIFDDSPKSNRRLRKADVSVVQVLNPVTPGREISDVRTLCPWGRRSALKQTLAIASKTEASRLLTVFDELAEGKAFIEVGPSQVEPVPQGTLLKLCEIDVPLAEAMYSLRSPQLAVQNLMKEVSQELRKQGGMHAEPSASC